MRPPWRTAAIAVSRTAARPVVSMTTCGPSGPPCSAIRVDSASSPSHSAANPHELNSSRRAATGSSTSTSAPRSAAARAAAAPIGPAPSTTTCSPAATRPRLTAWTETATGSMSEACRAERSGVATRFDRRHDEVLLQGAVVVDADDPQVGAHVRPSVAARVARPHGSIGHIATRSPGWKSEPAGSTCSTTAENSWPMIRGSSPTCESPSSSR